MIQAWDIDNGRVCLRSDAGEVRHLTAREVFAAAFAQEGQPNSELPPTNIVESLPFVTFSRFAAELALMLTGAISGAIFLQPGVCVDGHFVELAEGQDQVVAYARWFPVDIDDLNELGIWLSKLGIQLSHSISYRQVLLLKRAASGVVRVFDSIVTDPRLLSEQRGGTHAVPGLRADLYPYQNEGVRFLKTISYQGLGCILADEMGLGKTLQLIALLQSEKNNGRASSLVVAPATLLENWRREIATFAPNIRVHVHAGTSRTGDPTTFTKADVVLTSYDLVVRDEVLLNAVPWNVLILDEAQNIKNPTTQRASAVKRINRQVSIAVTGTPVENRLSDLWSLSDFALSGLLGTQPVFESNFEDTLSDAAALAELVAPIILRRSVTEVANDLPPRIDILQPILMSERLSALYEDARRAILAEYGPSGALVATTRLRALCTHPTLTSAWQGGAADDMPKYERLLELLDEIFERGEKVLIFTSFHAMADLLIEDLRARWPNGLFLSIDGRVPVAKRQLLVDEFAVFASSGAMVLNPKAAGTGLNITAANHVIHYNPEWNPALTAQSTARAFRRKQTRPVTVHHLYFADTVEDVIVSRADFKRQLAGQALEHCADVVPRSDLDKLALLVSPLVK